MEGFRSDSLFPVSSIRYRVRVRNQVDLYLNRLQMADALSRHVHVQLLTHTVAHSAADVGTFEPDELAYRVLGHASWGTGKNGSFSVANAKSSWVTDHFLEGVAFILRAHHGLEARAEVSRAELFIFHGHRVGVGVKVTSSHHWSGDTCADVEAVSFLHVDSLLELGF